MTPEALPAVSAQQMRAIDRVATDELGIDLLQLMETAGRGLATFVAERAGEGPIVVLAGKGGNGGGGLVAARHLANWGFPVHVAVVEETLRDATARQREVLLRSEVEVGGPGGLAEVDPAEVAVAVDAVIGYGLEADPRGDAALLVEFANRCAQRIALDVPSGLDATTGRAYRPCVRAHATLTLALPKRGLLRPEAGSYVGELWLADIGLPPAAYARAGLAVPTLFAPGQAYRRL